MHHINCSLKFPHSFYHKMIKKGFVLAQVYMWVYKVNNKHQLTNLNITDKDSKAREQVSCKG